MKVIGGLIIVVGAALGIGNVSGECQTFRLAGYATMLVGGVVTKAGT